MGLLLVGLAVVESALYATHQPLLSNQKGWRRAAVVAAWGALGAHLLFEAVRPDVAA